MIETIKEFFAASPILAWSVVSVLFAMVVAVTLWDQVKWWWLNSWMSFPLIGRISRLSKDFNMDSVDKTWFKAEKTLCRDYKKFIRVQDEHDFNEKIDYITKAGDNGRTPMPSWIWGLTVALVFAEAMGFSYVLAGWTIPGASETTQQYGALGIAFIISVILVAFTHWSGHELYVSTKVKHARREWAEDGRKHKFTTGVIPLARSQSIDNEQPGYTQLANRVGTHESYKISIATVVIVLIVAAGATYVRGQVLEKALHQEVVGANNQAEQSLKLNVDGLDMSATEGDNQILPDADVAENKAVKDKEVMDEVSIDRHGGWGTFIILAFIFMFLQILGGLFGYKWGFAGQNSKAAFKAIGNGRYSSYSEVRDHYNEIVDTAQAKLEALQQKIEYNFAGVGTSSGKHTTNTFRQFMEMERQEKSQDRDKEDGHTKKAAERKVQEVIAKPLTVDEAIQQLGEISDKDDKKSYIHSLPASLQAEVLVSIKAAKEAEKANSHRNQLDAELDDLL